MYVRMYVHNYASLINQYSLNSCTAAPVVDEPSPPNITADVGATITLSCISRGSPPDTYMWQREDDPMMLQSTSIGALEHTNTSAVFQATYTIDSVDFDNNGTYTCIVVNPIGSDNATITVIAISTYVYVCKTKSFSIIYNHLILTVISLSK